MYSNSISYSVGDSVHFFYSFPSNAIDLKISKIGIPDTLVSTFQNLPCSLRTNKDSVFHYGCTWPQSFSIIIEKHWHAGIYEAVFSIPQTGLKYNTIFVVKPQNPGRDSNILVCLNENTWHAYNPYGGKNFYYSNLGDNKIACKLSFNRPFTEEMLTSFIQPFKIFDEFAASENFCYEVAAQHDIYNDLSLLRKYKVVVLIHHSEYWTRRERRAFHNFVNNGGKLIVLSGNTCWWQVRYENNGKTLVCYKLEFLDPIEHKLDSLKTVRWHEWPLNFPENDLIGVSFRNGGYVNSGKVMPSTLGYGGYTAFNTHSWIYKNTGLNDGDVFGGEYAVVGNEVDGAKFKWTNGIPTVTSEDKTPSNFRILAIAPAAWDESNIIDGHGTLGFYHNGKGGFVFNSATLNWYRGLNDDEVVRTITKNVIRKSLEDKFPPEITEWGPSRVEKKVFNHEEVQLNKRDLKIVLGEKTRFFVKADNPYNGKLQYIWKLNGTTVCSDPVYFFVPTVADTFHITAYVLNSKDVSSISWTINVSKTTSNTENQFADVRNFALLQNYPNPFNPTTTIKYSLPQNCHVNITVYDELGREAEKLVDEEKSAGNYEIKFNGSNLASGVYFYRLQTGSFSESKKLILLK